MLNLHCISVLSDPHQRAIYDSLGTRGLETEGWEVVQRTKTPQELRDEYEQLAREREERRLEMRTNPRCNITLNVNATDLFSGYNEDYDDVGLVFHLLAKNDHKILDTIKLK